MKTNMDESLYLQILSHTFHQRPCITRNKNARAGRHPHKPLIQTAHFTDVERSVIYPRSGSQQVLRASPFIAGTMFFPHSACSACVHHLHPWSKVTQGKQALGADHPVGTDAAGGTVLLQPGRLSEATLETASVSALCPWRCCLLMRNWDRNGLQVSRRLETMVPLERHPLGLCDDFSVAKATPAPGWSACPGFVMVFAALYYVCFLIVSSYRLRGSLEFCIPNIQHPIWQTEVIRYLWR